MKKLYRFLDRLLGSIAAGAVITIALAGCDNLNTGDKEPDFTTGTVITLAADAWADGAITAENKEQWFKFTATAGMQYIHVMYGTMTAMDIQLHDSNGNALGDGINFHGASNTWEYVSRTLTSGQTYYIKITPGSYSYSYSKSGTYRIAFNTLPFPPDMILTTLAADTWADGTITASNKEQWFKFTATANTQYIHVSFGTMNDMKVQLRDSTGGALGNEISLYGSKTRHTSLMVTSGQSYYIRVTPGSYHYSYSNSGTYRIAFNTSETPPAE
jgi:hypothetical protein